MVENSAVWPKKEEEQNGMVMLLREQNQQNPRAVRVRRHESTGLSHFFKSLQDEL